MKVNGIDLTRFNFRERQIIVSLGLAYPGNVRMDRLIEIIYPNPDKEPDFPDQGIKHLIIQIRKKWRNPIWHIPVEAGRPGYRLECVARVAA